MRRWARPGARRRDRDTEGVDGKGAPSPSQPTRGSGSAKRRELPSVVRPKMDFGEILAQKMHLTIRISLIFVGRNRTNKEKA